MAIYVRTRFTHYDTSATQFALSYARRRRAARTRRTAQVCVYGRASGNERCEGHTQEGGKDIRDRGKGLRRGGVEGQERRDKERTDETTGAGEKEITAGSDRVVEINVARLIGATEECACGLSGSQLALLHCEDVFRLLDIR